GAMVLSGIFLLVSLIALGIRGLRRRPAVCSRCQATEQGRRRRFAHAPVGGTEWEEVTCPACGHAWYARL
ncbi:MAG TPA: hypothetical protein VKY74_17705, partial [Chloroflexia bacterium]|nr:hypothetical protein [Chloroflexia bacterium]